MDLDGRYTQMIHYDTPIEVSKLQYHKIISALTGYIAHRSSKGHYYIKL